MSAKIEFGMFDWVDRGSNSVGDLYESRLKLIESADKAGFYGYHLAEHHSTPLAMAPSPSVFFAALAQRTKQIRFSPMAYLLPMYHPLRLIEEVCMLDHLSNGRMELGVSRGVSPYEIATFSVDPEKTRENLHRSPRDIPYGDARRCPELRRETFRISRCADDDQTGPGPVSAALVSIVQ